MKLILTAVLFALLAYAGAAWPAPPRFGAAISYSQLTASNLPAHLYYGPQHLRYMARADLYGSWGPFVWQLDPLMEGGPGNVTQGYPTVGALAAAVGLRWHGLTVSLWHESAHNMDSAGAWADGSASLNANGVRISVQLGDRRDFGDLYGGL